MLNLNDLHFFAQAVDCGGFAAAARRLGCPKSTISKRVAALEATLGVDRYLRMCVCTTSVSRTVAGPVNEQG